jgi:hypothetical protein
MTGSFSLVCILYIHWQNKIGAPPTLHAEAVRAKGRHKQRCAASGRRRHGCPRRLLDLAILDALCASRVLVEGLLKDAAERLELVEGEDVEEVGDLVILENRERRGGALSCCRATVSIATTAFCERLQLAMTGPRLLPAGLCTPTCTGR